MKNPVWKREILTIPNLLSLFRLGLIPVYIPMYMNARTSSQHIAAGMILALSCLTDAADGLIARRFGMVSMLGKILDPLADKITQLTLILCLSLRQPLLKPILALFAAKEVFQLTLALFYFLQGKALPGALMAGKICTAILFFSLILLVLLPDPAAGTVHAVCVADGIALTVSFVSYGFAYFGKPELLRDVHTE